MGHADYYSEGDWNAVCSVCGGKFKASELIRHWQGFYRCRRCWEPRQPQDFVRAVPDNMTVPWAQPPSQTFVQICTINGQSALPGYAIPGCMVPGNKFIDPQTFAVP